MIIEQLNYITICYQSNQVNSVKLMIEEHYDRPELNNAIILLNPLYNNLINERNLFCYMSQQYDKVIYYELEHRYYSDLYDNCIAKEWDNDNFEFIKTIKPNEIWTMDYRSQFAVRCEQELGIPIIYKPMRYTTLIKPVENIYVTPKSIDCCLPGILTCAYLRQDFFSEVERSNSFSMALITKTKNLTECIHVFNTCKYILDIPRIYEISSPNQVRIFELLCMGYTVCSKQTAINMFPGLVYQWETVDELRKIINRGEYLHPTEAYKEMTYTDDAYEKYVNYLIEQWNTVD